MAAPTIDRVKDKLELGRFFSQAMGRCRSGLSSWKEAVSHMSDVAQIKGTIGTESYALKRSSFEKVEELDLEKMRKDPNYYADYIKKSYKQIPSKK